MPIGGGGGGSNSALLVNAAVYGVAGGSASIPSGTATQVPWAFLPGGGPNLFNLTDPTNPAVLVAGIYAVNVNAAPGTTAFAVELGIDPVTQGFTMDVTLNTSGLVCGILYVPAGGVIYVSVEQTTGSNHNFGFATWVQRIA